MAIRLFTRCAGSVPLKLYKCLRSGLSTGRTAALANLTVDQSDSPPTNPVPIIQIFTSVTLYAIAVDTFWGGPTAEWSAAIGLITAAGGLLCWWVSATLRKSKGEQKS